MSPVMQPDPAKPRYLVRSADVPGYAPANHQHTVNQRLVGPDNVGARQMEVVLGTLSPGGGALPHAHPGIEQACYLLEGSARAEAQLLHLPLKPDRFVACLPIGHALADPPSLRIAELAGERFAMFDRDAAPANCDNVIAIFSRAGVHPRTCHAARASQATPGAPPTSTRCSRQWQP